MMEQTLLKRLLASVEGMGLERVNFGYPELVVKEVQRAETLFKEFSKAKPSSQDAYKAASQLLAGEKLDDWSTDLVAAAISIPIQEHQGRTVLESNYCDDLLRRYENDAYAGDLWRLTWYSLLNSYLTFDLGRTSTESGKLGFAKLRQFLAKTWPSIDTQSGNQTVPDWIRILREEAQLLTAAPVDKYANDYLSGKIDHIKAIAENLGIPANSWFWQELVLGAVRRATQGNDEQFRGQILMLIELIRHSNFYRDQAIVEILNRYFKCASRTVNAALRDFVIHSTVWKNPKLKTAGIATAWNQVPEPVWRMVLSWVNERNLRDFFDILAARRNSDHGRLKFWSRYMSQIHWTKLVFGSETVWQKNHNAGIKALLESEEGTYATLQGGSDRELDAFLMQIGDYVFVEFSKTGNGAYAYNATELKFDPYAPSYLGTTADLRCGYYSGNGGVLRIVHRDGWEERAAYELTKLRIYPDKPNAHVESEKSQLSNQQIEALNKIQGLRTELATSSPVPSLIKHDKLQDESQSIPVFLNTASSSNSLKAQVYEKSGSLTVEDVQKIISKYSDVRVHQTGVGSTKRLWVNDSGAHVELAKELKQLGFRWSNSREAWYWIGD